MTVQHWIKWRWIVSGVLGLLIGLALVFLLPQKERKHFPRWPKKTSSLSSIPSRHPHGRAEEDAETDRGISRAGSLQGRLLDARSLEVVPGAVVSLHDDPGSAVESDGQGLFELEVARQLPAVALLHKEGYPLIHLRLMEVPEARVDIFLFQEVKVLALVSDDVTSAPVNGAVVTIEQPAGAVSALSDPEGIAGPISVKPFLKLTHPAGEEPGSRLDALRVAVDSPGYKTLQTTVEPEGELTKILLRLRPMGTLQGQVVDPRGSPVPGAKVMGWWSINIGKDTDEFGSSRAISIDQGLFELEVPSRRDGFLQVGAAREGFGPAVINLDLDRQATLGPVVLALRHGRDLQGMVIDRSGNPLEGVRISLEGEPLKGIREALRNGLGDVYDSPIGMTESDEEGLFAVAGLPAGFYNVKVFHPRHVLSQPLSVTLPCPGDLQVVLDEGLSISGLVVDPEKGIPVSTANVIANAHGDPKDARSFDVDPEGEFRITGVRADHLYDLTAIAKGYHHQNLRKISPGAKDVLIAMEPIPEDVPGMSGRLILRFTCSDFKVHDYNGFIQIGIYDQAGNRQGSFRRRSAVNGQVMVEDLPEGVFDLAISSDRYAPIVIEDVPIDPDGSSLEVKLEPGCTVFGEESPPGCLPRNAVLELRDLEHDFPISLIYRRRGGWRLDVLEQGKPYLLSFIDRGSVLGRQTFVASCDEVVPLRLDPGK